MIRLLNQDDFRQDDFRQATAFLTGVFVSSRESCLSVIPR